MHPPGTALLRSVGWLLFASGDQSLPPFLIQCPGLLLNSRSGQFAFLEHFIPLGGSVFPGGVSSHLKNFLYCRSQVTNSSGFAYSTVVEN